MQITAKEKTIFSYRLLIVGALSNKKSKTLADIVERVNSTMQKVDESKEFQPSYVRHLLKMETKLGHCEELSGGFNGASHWSVDTIQKNSLSIKEFLFNRTGKRQYEIVKAVGSLSRSEVAYALAHLLERNEVIKVHQKSNTTSPVYLLNPNGTAPQKKATFHPHNMTLTFD